MARQTVSFLHMDWPPQSPDLSPLTICGMCWEKVVVRLSLNQYNILQKNEYNTWNTEPQCHGKRVENKILASVIFFSADFWPGRVHRGV